MGIRLGTLAATYRVPLERPYALQLEQQALRIAEATLGPGHPDMGIRLAKLTLALLDQCMPTGTLRPPAASELRQVRWPSY